MSVHQQTRAWKTAPAARRRSRVQAPQQASQAHLWRWLRLENVGVTDEGEPTKDNMFKLTLPQLNGQWTRYMHPGPHLIAVRETTPQNHFKTRLALWRQQHATHRLELNHVISRRVAAMYTNIEPTVTH